MAMKGYSTLPRPLELESHHQIHFSVIPRIPTFWFVGGGLPLRKEYSQCILSPSNWAAGWASESTSIRERMCSGAHVCPCTCKCWVWVCGRGSGATDGRQAAKIGDQLDLINDLIGSKCSHFFSRAISTQARRLPGSLRKRLPDFSLGVLSFFLSFCSCHRLFFTFLFCLSFTPRLDF